jgi:hypothetical protein
MINSRLTSLIRKEFIQILRDPRTLALVLIIPTSRLPFTIKITVRRRVNCWMRTAPQIISKLPMMWIRKINLAI